MAFETERANIVQPTDEISAILGGALVEKMVIVPLIYKEAVPMDTNVKKFRKAGSLIAADVAESTSYTYDAGDEYTETAVSATAAKTLVISKLTAEAERFGGNSRGKLATAAGEAIGRALDDKAVALFDGFSNQVTATSVLTVDKLLDAAYTVHNALAGDSRQLIGALDYKGANEIKKEIVASSAAAYAQPGQTSPLTGQFEQGNGFIGSVPGIDLYATTGLPTDTGDDVGLVFNPNKAFAGIMDPSIQYREVFKASEGVYTELAAWLFNDIVEWYDEAGCGVKSDS